MEFITDCENNRLDRRDPYSSLSRTARRIGVAVAYLRKTGSRAMIADLQDVLVRSPKQSLAIAMTAGLLLGTTLRSLRR
jgi:hypothetical protein